jgi:hypothetical protein
MELPGVARARPRLALDHELVLAGLTVAAVTIVYLAAVVVLGVPAAASGLFGHSIGLIGFALMVATETLYSLRKRTRRAGMGRMSTWLKFHIYTGIVGPYLVFLHTAWKFHGLAGLTLLMTAVVVGSGFFGRYIYTSVPRTADGAVLERAEIERMLQAAVRAAGSEPPARLRREPGLVAAMLMVLGRFVFPLRDELRGWIQGLRLDKAARTRRAKIDALTRRRDELERQLLTLGAARRLLAAWHTLHVPLGLAMFSMAIVHAAAAMYFATLMK